MVGVSRASGVGAAENAVLITRRSVLYSGVGATLGWLPVTAWSDGAGCDLWDRIMARVEAERVSLPQWAVSVAPVAIESARVRVESLQRALRDADENVDDARRLELLGLANAAGSSLFFIVGLATGGTAAAIVFAGAVLFGSGIIVVRSLVAPESVDGVDIAKGVALERLEGVLDTSGDGHYVVSESTRKFTKIGGVLVGAGTLAFDWIEFVRSTEEVRRASSTRQSMEKLLAEAENALDELKARVRAEEMREACLAALEHDVETLRAGRCSVIPPAP